MTLEIAALGLTHLLEGAKDLAPGSGGVHHQQIGADAAIQKPGARRVAAGSMGCLDEIDGVIGPHQRAGRFNEFRCAVVSLATTIARTVGM